MPTSQQLPRPALRSLPADQRSGGSKFARAIGAYLPKVTSAVFERYGFHSAEIMTSWGTIVGADLARLTRPQSIKWPRDNRDGDGSDGRGGATLVVACDPAFALEVSYRTADIADRINQYFGYRAVARLKVQQTPGLVTAKTPAESVSTADVATAPADLTESLAKLARSVAKVRAR